VGEIYQFDTSGKKLLGALTGCGGPEGMQIDRSGNLWAACTNDSTVAGYPAGASTPKVLLSDVLAGITYYPAAAVADAKGNVFATNLYGETCNSASCSFYNGNIVYWTASNACGGCAPSGIVADPNINGAYFLAVDTAGDLYVDYQAGSAAGLDEIQNPTSQNPTVTTLVSPSSGLLEVPGGVALSNNETILNVLDQQAGLIDRFTLPGLEPLSALGPLPQNIHGSCDGVAMGFDAKSKTVAVADGGCGIAFGTVKKNKFKSDPNINLTLPIQAVYDPSGS
jgi:hypothetical protein